MMNRIYHHYNDCEDSHSEMWSIPKDREKMLKEAIKFTKNTELYGKAMLRVINEWPNSCEHYLTNVNLNRQAWIGHAACALEKGFCEDVVREAWRYLTEQEQEKANKKADEAIKLWELEHAKKISKG